MLRPVHLMSGLALMGVTLGGAFATSALDSVNKPASVDTAAQRVDAGSLLRTPPVDAGDDDLIGVVDLVNARRSAAGLESFAWHEAVARAASAHSTDMAQHGEMQHAGTDGSDAGDRLSRQGFAWNGWGETIAAGYSDPVALIEAWMNSPGHRAILLGSFHYVGIAVVDAGDGTPYWTLVAASGG